MIITRTKRWDDASEVGMKKNEKSRRGSRGMGVGAACGLQFELCTRISATVKLKGHAWHSISTVVRSGGSKAVPCGRRVTSR